jgi:hypothetical protein
MLEGTPPPNCILPVFIAKDQLETENFRDRICVNSHNYSEQDSK